MSFPPKLARPAHLAAYLHFAGAWVGVAIIVEEHWPLTLAFVWLLACLLAYDWGDSD